MDYGESILRVLLALQQKGYSISFIVQQNPPAIYCPNTKQILNPATLTIDEIHHLEQNDHVQETIVYAISSEKNNSKGTIVADSSTITIVEALGLSHYPIANKPLRRAKTLVSFSREHHYALLLCWKIKMGLAKNIAIDRINAYLQWFYETHLLPHFEMEEKWLFPILAETNTHKKNAIEQHQQLRILFEQQNKDVVTLATIQDVLNEHIRFEERVLFNEIQNAPNFEQLNTIVDLHQETKFVDNETDAFWK